MATQEMVWSYCWSTTQSFGVHRAGPRWYVCTDRSSSSHVWLDVEAIRNLHPQRCVALREAVATQFPNSCTSTSQSSSPRQRLRTTRSSEAMEAEGAAGVGKEREIGGFHWACFFSNRYILLQILLYVYLFYTKLPGLDEVRPLLVWLLLLLPMCALNLIGTHKLKELAARRQRKD